MITLVSTTSFTSPPLGPDGVHLGLDLFQGHRLAWLSADSIEHMAEFGCRFTPAQFDSQQVPDGRGFQQPAGLGLLHQRLRQIQLNGDAHTGDKMAANGLACQAGAKGEGEIESKV